VGTSGDFINTTDKGNKFLNNRLTPDET